MTKSKKEKLKEEYDSLYLDMSFEKFKKITDGRRIK